MDVNVVRTIMHRLHVSGIIEKRKRGRYRYNNEIRIPDQMMMLIINDLRDMSNNVLGTGSVVGNEDLSDQNNPLEALILILDRISKTTGRSTALNMLRVSARRHISSEETGSLISSVREIGNPRTKGR